MKAKRTYKDSLFRHIFNDKKRLASLYKALTGETVSPKDIRITALSGVFYNDIKNDISFSIGDRDIILMEHQSSWNPNMPLRMLWYLAKLYNRQLRHREIVYHDTLIRIPAPEFYVFYNGHKERPDYEVLHLSDAFQRPTQSMDLFVNCYNINYGTPSKLLDGCYELRCYSILCRKSGMVSKAAWNSRPLSAKPSPTARRMTSWQSISRRTKVRCSTWSASNGTRSARLKLQKKILNTTFLQELFLI